MSFENQRPDELVEFSSDAQFSGGPYPGSQTKVKPPLGTFSTGMLPEQQYPAEWKNFIDNHYTRLWAWFKEMQLRNWFEIASYPNSSTLAAISGAVKNIYGDTVLVFNDDGSDWHIFGDMGPLVRPVEGGGNPTIKRIPDSYDTQGFPIVFSKNGIAVDITGRYVIIVGTNSNVNPQCAMQLDFDRAALNGRKGIHTELTLTDFESSFDNNVAYDSSTDTFMIAGIDGTTGADTHSWVSTDKGANWSTKVLIAAGAHSIASNNRGRFIAIHKDVTTPTYSISDDAGATWVAQGTIADFGFLKDLVWSENHRRFFAISRTAGAFPAGFWESTDGIVWEMIADLVQNGGLTTQVATTITGDPKSLIVDGDMISVFHAGRADIAVSGLAAGVIVSHDAGRTWIEMTMTIDHTLNTEDPELGTIDDLHVVFDGSAYWCMQLRDDGQTNPDSNIYRTIALGNNDARAFALPVTP